ncbi:MAG: HD domain-containing protein [Propionibacteriaceae bacterium]|jgi:(p)ppGpp synthase/HD superfamily hydrolase|nr:HD domain-containing protein [Propionibacteriaceae bacterium]
MNESLVEVARRLATQAHGEQKDRAGRPYIDHPRRVAGRLEDQGETAEVVAAGWLHDVLEDTPITTEDFRALGIPEAVIEAVESVTKRPDESKQDYALRVKSCEMGLKVKRADLADNMDPNRLALLDEPTRERLTEKYATMVSLLDAQ